MGFPTSLKTMWVQSQVKSKSRAGLVRIPDTSQPGLPGSSELSYPGWFCAIAKQEGTQTLCSHWIPWVSLAADSWLAHPLSCALAFQPPILSRYHFSEKKSTFLLKCLQHLLSPDMNFGGEIQGSSIGDTRAWTARPSAGASRCPSIGCS